MTPDPDDHAFVIQLYADEGRQLRGHITHAASGRRAPLRRPGDVLAFLDPYLAGMGVRLGLRGRLLLWACRRGPAARR
jgi:hypothetical protein